MPRRVKFALVLIVILIFAGLVIRYWHLFLALSVTVSIMWFMAAFVLRKRGNSGEVTDLANQEEVPAFAYQEAVRFTPVTHTAKANAGDGAWVSGGVPVEIAGYRIQDGLIYVGTYLPSPTFPGVDCALINPELPVDRTHDDYTVAPTDCPASYAAAPPAARAAYLRWLAEGRADPAAHTGYVFLYYYGLERRLLYDTQYSHTARKERGLLLAEIRRLLDIYPHDGSFYADATSLLLYLRSEDKDAPLYRQPAPPFSYRAGCSAPLTVGLGQMIRDGSPIPADWALAWYFSVPDPPFALRKAAIRCQQEFKTLFTEEYTRSFGDGIILTTNNRKLTLTFRPASRSLSGLGPYQKYLDIPDITTMTEPLTRIGHIVQKVQETLGGYSRYLARYPDRAHTMDALLLLPPAVWPESVKSSLDLLKRVALSGNGQHSTRFTDLLTIFPEWKDRSRKRMSLFSEVLEAYGLGIEPDPRFGGTLPDEQADVVIFVLGDEPMPVAELQYITAALSLYMAMLVFSGNGATSPKVQLLSEEIDRWPSLRPTEKKRLHAYLEWLNTQNLHISEIKKRIKLLTPEQKQQLGEEFSRIMQRKATIGRQEAALLSDLLNLLGIDTTAFYGKIRRAIAEPVGVYTPPSGEAGFVIPGAPATGTVKIDMAKLAALQTDSEHITSILSDIFAQSEVETSVPTGINAQAPPTGSSRLWALPPNLSDFVRAVSQKPAWPRSELEELARERGLMLEGTLERINETALDRFGEPFTDGSQIIDINQEIAEAVINDIDQA